MHAAVPAPSPEHLALVVEQYPKQTPKQNQARVRHNRRNEPTTTCQHTVTLAGIYIMSSMNMRNSKKQTNLPRLLRPRRDELAEPITPDILVDGDADKQTARNGFVAIHSIRADNCR